MTALNDHIFLCFDIDNRYVLKHSENVLCENWSEDYYIVRGNRMTCW